MIKFPAPIIIKNGWHAAYNMTALQFPNVFIKNWNTRFNKSLNHVPNSPNKAKVIGRQITSVKTGLKKYCKACGINFSNAFVTYPINHTPSNIGKNELEYVIVGRFIPIHLTLQHH